MELGVRFVRLVQVVFHGSQAWHSGLKSKTTLSWTATSQLKAVLLCLSIKDNIDCMLLPTNKDYYANRHSWTLRS